MSRNVPLEEITDNEEIRRYMESFKSMGIQSDSSGLPNPMETLKSFLIPDDLEIDLVLSEPQINQPVEINFDHRGRLWVVEYQQYPYPKGSKVVDIDNHARVVFDKVPKPPTEGVKGADKITMFEDTNGDGIYDKSINVISGLNITTAITWGRGKIWVLTPPYLVAYTDKNDDGIPEGDPEVHLSGFGLEDTHAVANSLRWGPDGWLYGAQGSTTTATINSAASKDVHFKGQGIWRYHPETKIFELFAEGGGNTFDTEFDAKGRLYSGTNEGAHRGYYYKQGGYYRKNWGKHGALTNPYAFGFLPGMALEGEKYRFTHAFIKYEGNTLPERYNEKILSLNPLHNFVWMSRVEQRESSFLCVDEEKIIQSDDHWFRPVDIKTGPDGAVYIADWSDSRLSHVNPLDTWHKASGRVYRLRNKNKTLVKPFDLSSYSNEELIDLLSHKNKWFRQQAQRIIGDRGDKTMIPELSQLLSRGNNQLALEALWAINNCGGFNDDIAIESMSHKDPFVRMWVVRLVGDKREVSERLGQKITQLAVSETHLEVLGQIASSAKRLPAKYAVPILNNLFLNKATANDTENRMFIWWALESKAETGRDALLALFENPQLWNSTLVKEVVLERLTQRYTLVGGKENYKAAIKLFDLAPTDAHSKLLFIGLQEGIRGKDLAFIPEDLKNVISECQSKFGVGKLTFALRQNNPEAVKEALKIIADNKANWLERIAYIEVFGDVYERDVVPILLKLVEDNSNSVGLRLACVKSLGNYKEKEIGERLANAYNHKIRADLDLREAVFRLFASRPDWTKSFLDIIYTSKQIKKEELPLDVVRQFKLHQDDEINNIIGKLWPEVEIATSEQKTASVLKIKNALASGTGNVSNGKELYIFYCSSCHKMNGEGADIGPDLSGYDRSNTNYMVLNIVDPNADIREGYVNYVIKKKNGQVVVGILQDRSEYKVIIKPLGADPITITKEEINTMEAQKISLMPERLTDTMTNQEIRDLFEFLKQK
ncbi:PVC-type heme-binding CxxCH protein [Seonamhaeicola maritimus]|uniref:PVC-type heme-binding CxxCH protein n=1 Tax=Seonamhaeicola maritimus TaxID=2591822 RepID=UPI002493D0F4|nr:PVC-type heme-binding CxxCH protein [Seonamhaeicola maritimus]